jgi:hypothetical protein
VALKSAGRLGPRPTRYRSLANFCTADPRRVHSRERDVGLWWREQADGPRTVRRGALADLAARACSPLRQARTRAQLEMAATVAGAGAMLAGATGVALAQADVLATNSV